MLTGAIEPEVPALGDVADPGRAHSQRTVVAPTRPPDVGTANGRLNNPGRFDLPATRVEALYAPEMLGEVPNVAVTVKP